MLGPHLQLWLLRRGSARGPGIDPPDRTTTTFRSPDPGSPTFVRSVERVSQASAVRISWRLIAVIALIADLGLVAALSIIASIGNNDALSTVALAVAVFSLITQLVVTFVQFLLSQQQQASGEAIARATSEALADIREASRATRDAVRGYVDQLVSYVLADLKGRAETPEEARLLERVQEKLAEDIPQWESAQGSIVRNLRRLD